MSGRKIYGLFLFLFIFQLVSGAIVFYQSGLNDIRKQVEHKHQRLLDGLKIDSASWDISSYNNDPELIGIYPLYVITLDGIIVDRRAPIGGLLDVIDISKFLEFEEPATISIVKNQERRTFVSRIEHENALLGIVVVSYYNPGNNLEKIDQKLKKNASYILSSIKVKDKKIDTTSLDVRRVDFDIAFSVVDKFNTIIERSDNVNAYRRTPSYIDPGYVRLALSSLGERLVQDPQTGERFLTVTYQIKDPEGIVSGVAVIGESVDQLSRLVRKYLLFQGLIGLLLASLAFVYFKRRVHSRGIKKSINIPKDIEFDQKSSQIIIDGVKVDIPYSTNQYYLLQALFSNPSKRWETDELLDKFGEEDITNWRKVYDTMIAVNKKVEDLLPAKLLINKNKTYQLNPHLFPKKVESKSD